MGIVDPTGSNPMASKGLMGVVGLLLVAGLCWGGGVCSTDDEPASILGAGLSGTQNRGLTVSMADGGSMEIWVGLIAVLLIAAGVIYYVYFYDQKPDRGDPWG